MKPVPVTVLDQFGRTALPKNYLQRDYEAAGDSRYRKYYGSSVTKPEGEMLRPPQRRKIIAHLRRAMRNNLVVKSMVMRYALSVGHATVHSETDDPLYNDLKERYLEKKFKRIGYPRRLGLKALQFIITIERLLGGEVFIILTKDGRLQLIPSELCGSPENPPDREVDGIGYDSNGEPSYYRFGSRVKDKSANRTQLSFERGDSTVVSAEWVRHHAVFDRIEENRATLPLAPAVAAIQDLDDIVTSKVMQIKLQSAYTMFITKNMDPQLLSEMIDSSSDGEYYRGMATARGNYQDVRSGSIMYGEIGEDAKPISPQIQASDFSEFERSRLYFICACIGIPPEEAILGYGGSNYSSSRADKLRWRQVVNADREAHIDNYLADTQAWICRRGVGFNELPNVPAGQSYEVNYTWPPIPTIDPMKEAQEDVLLLESGLETRSEIVGRRGRHYDSLDAQIIREAKGRAKMLLEAAGETREPTLDEIRAEMPNADRAAAVLKSLAESAKVEQSNEERL